MAKPLVSVIVPIALTNGNEGRNKHFGAAAKRRKEYEQTLRAMGLVRQPFDFPISLTLTRILGKGQRYYDPDSVLRGSAKELIDALTACGWWHDDSIKHITAVYGLQDDTRRAIGPATEIRVMKTDE